MLFKIIVDNISLDLYEGNVIQLTNSISDIRNIEEKTTLYSQTINIPATKTNQRAFGFLNQPMVFNEYNTNLKKKCTISIDNVPVVEGDLQIINSIKNRDGVYYECIIIGLNNDIFMATKNVYINDLDYSELNHTYNLENVYGSWTGATGTTAWNYYYPYIERGDNYSRSEIQYDDLVLETGYTWYPSIRAKNIWDKIWSGAGFTYESDFISNDVNFNNIYIPFTEEALPIQSTKTLLQTDTDWLVVGHYYYNSDHGDGREMLYNHVVYKSGDTGSPSIDLANTWHAEDGPSSACTAIYFEAPVEGTYTFIVEVGVFYTGVTSYPSAILDMDHTLTVYQGMPLETPEEVHVKRWEHFGIGSTGTTTFQLFLIENERVSLGTELHPDNNPTTNSYEIYWYHYYDMNVVATEAELIMNYTEINMSDFVPKMYQWEFIKNIIIMYNLYFEKEPFSENYIIEKREDYYALGDYKDWSDKLNMDSDFKLSYFNELDVKKYNFQYQSDSDYDNSEYENLYEIMYGSTGITMNNEYSTSEQTIEVTFSPTVVIPMDETSLVPIASIREDNNSTFATFPKYNTRFLYRVESGLGTWTNRRTGVVYNYTYSFNGHSLSKIYTMSHFNNTGTSMTDDLNFYTGPMMYSGVTTESNLYNNNWRDYIRYINDKDTEILEAWFKIDYLDYLNLRFNDHIWLGQFNSWWNVNIIEYQINTPNLVKIELIKERVGADSNFILFFDSGLDKTAYVEGGELKYHVYAFNMSGEETLTASGTTTFQGTGLTWSVNLGPYEGTRVENVFTNISSGTSDLVVTGDYEETISVTVYDRLHFIDFWGFNVDSDMYVEGDDLTAFFYAKNNYEYMALPISGTFSFQGIDYNYSYLLDPLETRYVSATWTNITSGTSDLTLTGDFVTGMTITVLTGLAFEVETLTPNITMTLPTYGLPPYVTYNYNANVNWGDSLDLIHIDSYDDTGCTHTYANPGTYKIIIYGTFEVCYTRTNYAFTLALRKILSWGDVGLKWMRFSDSINLTDLPNNRSGALSGVSYNLTSIFENCTSLTTIPEGCFDSLPNRPFPYFRFDKAFKNCTSLTTLPLRLFGTYKASAVYFLETFMGCTSLTTIPYDIFSGCTNNSSFKNTFYGCSGLTSVPTGCTVGNANSQLTFENTFKDCINLSTIGDDFFRYSPKANTFVSTFENCLKLSAIPEDLFRYNTQAFDFTKCFYNCRSLTNIRYPNVDAPSNGPFRYNTIADSFDSTFMYCTGITLLPSKMFEFNVEATDFTNTFRECWSLSLTLYNSELFRYTATASDFSECFYGCVSNTYAGSSTFFYGGGAATGIDFSGVFDSNSMTTINKDLFKYCYNAENFNTTFKNCNNLTAVPTDLFRYTTNAKTFMSTFYNCYNIVTISDELFYYTTGVTSFYNTFAECTKLSGISFTLFDECKDVTSFIQTFYNCTGLLGFSNYLWIRENLYSSWYTPGILGTDCYAFCSGLTDYDTIPINWGGLGLDDAFQMEVYVPTLNYQVKIPTDSGYSYNYIIDWGDGNLSNITGYTDAGCTHKYTTTGTMIIAISGQCDTLGYGTGTSADLNRWRLMARKILSFGSMQWKVFTLDGYPNLQYLPNDSKGQLRYITDVDRMFNGCVSLDSVPDNLLSGCTINSTFYEMFNGCTSLNGIGSGFTYAPYQYTTDYTPYDGGMFTKMFNGCSKLNNIQENLFDGWNGNGIDDDLAYECFNDTFAGCRSLSSVPENLFKNHTYVKSFDRTFQGTELLTTVPENLFKFNTGVTSFYATFQGNDPSTGVPHFTGGITSIPENLFKFNTLVTRFSSCFYANSGYTSIPQNLFKYNTLTTSDAFRGTFAGCVSLTEIPADLFINNTGCTDFGYTFAVCCSLSTIPSTIFTGCTITELDSTFDNYAETYYTYSGTATAPDLWTRYPSAYHDRTFYGTNSWVNYASIPAGWK